MRQLAFLLLLLTATTTANAQSERAAVASFDGRGAGRIRNYVVRAIRGEVRLQPIRQVEAAAGRQGLSSPEGIRAAARSERLTFVITGTVEGRGRSARATLRAFDREGSQLATIGVSARTGARGRREVGRAAQQLLRDARSELRDREADEQARRLEEEAAQRAEAEAQPESDPIPEASESSLPRLRALLGFQARDREAEIDFGAGRGRRGYSASFHAELGVRIESFPFGNSEGAARGLYVEGDFFHSVGLASEDQNGAEIGSSAWRLMLGLGYLYPVADDFLRLGAVVGLGFDAFRLDANAVLPSSTYGQLRFGAVASFRLVEDLLRARLDISYRYLWGVGELSDAFGSDASGGGFDTRVTVEGTLARFLTYGLQFGFTRYHMSFDGDAMVADAQLSDDVSGTDRSLYFQVLAGYAFY